MGFSLCAVGERRVISILEVKDIDLSGIMCGLLDRRFSARGSR